MLSSELHNMDTTYLGNEFSKGMIDAVKKSMTLDFASRSNGNLLDSPDLKMVQWTTPDLENMIFQQNGLLSFQTPTPGGLMRLVSLREDEKPVLRGFDEALAKLHAQRNAESLQQFAESEFSPAPPRNTEAQSMQQIELVYSCAPSKRPFNETIIEVGRNSAKQARFTSASATNATEDDSCSTSDSSSWSEEDDESFSQRHVPRGALSLASSPRTAATRQSGAAYAATTAAASRNGHGHPHKLASRGAGNVQPVDFGSQDRMRVERKRERNRLAARKCRERKIKKIDELTSQVQKLESDKKNLSTRISRMQVEISRLQSVIQDHAHSGCKIPLGPR